MSHDVAVQAPDGIDAEGLKASLAALLDAVPLTEAELSVVLTDDPTIQALNAEWRGKDAATDVLSFSQQEPPVSGGMLGDLVVSLDTARRQAAEQQHDIDAELRVLMVHGLCHLLGHDHHEPEETAAMAEEEARLLAAWGTTARSLVARVHAG